MRIDLLSIFPDYFAPLGVSLLGKAGEHGLVDLRIRDLREWTHDRHRSVDDTPYGGGAGMVMMPSVWGEAIDEVFEEAETGGQSDRRVLAIPTPSGVPLTQSMAQDLTNATQLVIACGRYEGIDQRVAEHYREAGFEVLEYSIGDYVLNGGEVAALVLVEAVTRLLDGFMGNPDSIVEESYSQGLLEYPAYTKPRSWRGLEVPEVLLSGDHGAISRWRRDRSLERTAARRPDLLASLNPEELDSSDLELLAGLGFLLREGRTHELKIRSAQIGDADALSAIAARTFPDACPSELCQEAIEAFVAAELSEKSFAGYLCDPQRYRILLALVEGEAVGYTLTLFGEDALDEALVRKGRIEKGDAYLSKCYVDSTWRGSGLASALLEAAVRDAAEKSHAPRIVVATNEANLRAQRFYKKHGFKKAARRSFNVGGVVNRDLVFVRDLTGLRGQ